MIIYQATKEEFLEHVEEDLIEQKIYEQYSTKIGRTSQSEIASWNHSMQYMYKVLNTNAVPRKAGIAIEYRLPTTSKRVDFIITGENEFGKETVIIIELKQWQKAERVNKEDVVRTFVGHKEREVAHPSYQAWSYAAIIRDYNETVQNQDIELHPCSYLHNYITQDGDPILDEEIYGCLKKAPLFKNGDVKKLREFIERYVQKPDQNKTLYKIEHGKIRPSKSLQDALLKMLQGNQEFVMIDSQKVVYETALNQARFAFDTGKKQVIIVEGGPGTGKSVLAINLLVQLTNESMVCQYISKNSAPREVYKRRLQSNYKKSYIDNLFKGSGSYVDSNKNELDVLIVDEAHRLNEKSGMFKNIGENQTKEIIHAAKCAIFFIDECQRVTASDVGSIEEIESFAKKQGAQVIKVGLDSQFRCNGSDGYLAWIDDVLGIRETANDIGFEHDYLFEVLDNPNELKQIIYEKNSINNKARMVAGYCWEWIKAGKENTNVHDINLPDYDFSMSWNLGNTNTWAIDEESVQEVGCIHTCQGLEFDYVGVIIGMDMIYRDGKVITDYTKRAKTDKSLNGLLGKCKKRENEALALADKIIRNTYRTLMTRGQKGCYVFCEDIELGKYLKERMQINKVQYGEMKTIGLIAEGVENYHI
ncbi:DUF2075 domain-containing protein [Cellulosilyticum lentocellum]|uniref:AAA+ ATPase domain-containing protein n=1 Tax=Cellulosilyticum lentocellum (strain ATCC 49066 / DSM 5427 / NCIMB 11756 / RHM5) TaxID=642492 RepID=F2JSD3_CELLD|nr:DUF2075 domain-containing protein [Cellulosilyticum lentocellum]ADZ85171.1 Protein of unknown function DUF2075 [Cellulosilyticum lentocellum DSM 5427]